MFEMLDRLMITQRFSDDLSHAIIGPYSAEIWPAALRASRMGAGYGSGNTGTVIGPLGPAVAPGRQSVPG
ncbi:MAG: hypothetical protein JO162_13520 [Alphaproteobacteria bacterium]|nr:hypothetical protein [Alphaproteobacteria bacterium]